MISVPTLKREIQASRIQAWRTALWLEGTARSLRSERNG